MKNSYPNKEVFQNIDFANLHADNQTEVHHYTSKYNRDKFENISLIKKLELPFSINGQSYIKTSNTPQGYGGPFFSSFNKDFLHHAFREYKSHQRKQNVICEFYRLNPFCDYTSIANEFDFFKLDRNICCVDLLDPSAEDILRYSKNTRHTIRRADRELEIELSKSFLSDFVKLYKSSMVLKSASSEYMYENRFFEKLMIREDVTLISVMFKKHVISAAIFLRSAKDNAYYYLSANSPEYKNSGANYFLIHYAIKYFKRLGYKNLILGGGLTTKPDDNLFKFKKKFSNKELNYFIGGINFNIDLKEQVTNRLEKYFSHSAGVQSFQRYRSFLE